MPGTEALSIRPAFAVLRRYPRGAWLAAAGDRADRVFLLCQGQVRVFLLSESGHETTTAILGPRQLVGISALLGRPTYRAFAEALTSVEAWSISAEHLVVQLSGDRRLVELILESLTQRLTLTQGLLRDIALLPVPERLANAVRRLEVALDGDLPRLRRGDLAALVGARPETVSRATGRSRAAGEGAARVGPL